MSSCNNSINKRTRRWPYPPPPPAISPFPKITITPITAASRLRHHHSNDLFPVGESCLLLYRFSLIFVFFISIIRHCINPAILISMNGSACRNA